MTRPRKDLETVRDLLDQGLSISEAARRAGVPRGTVQMWVSDGIDDTLDSRVDGAGEDARCEFCRYVRVARPHPLGWVAWLQPGDVRGKQYEYPRYMFSNRSADIRRVFTDACDRAGIEWRQNYEWMISVARRDSVERMDRFIGPKS